MLEMGISASKRAGVNLKSGTFKLLAGRAGGGETVFGMLVTTAKVLSALGLRRPDMDPGVSGMMKGLGRLA